MFTSSRVLTLAAFATAALAQTSTLIDQLPTECKNAVNTLISDTDVSTCLGVKNVVKGIDLYLGNTTSSLIAPFNAWLTDICAIPACSEATLNKITDSLGANCGLYMPDGFLTKYYPTIRKAVCLKQGSSNCVTQTLTNVEKIIGVLDTTMLSNIFSDEVALKLVTAIDVYCTDCVKGIYSTLAEGIPEVAEYKDVFQEQCGATFTNGTIPAGIVSSASTSASASTTNDTTNGTATNGTAKGETPASGALGVVSVLSQSTVTVLGGIIVAALLV